MKSNMVKYLILLFIVVIGESCIRKILIKQEENTILNTFVCLLKESEEFLSQKQQEDFKDSLNLYIINCKDYNFNDGRLEPVICQPVLLNGNHKKAIVPVLERTSDLSGGRVEYIHYISAKFESGKWYFKVKKGWSESFSYVNNYPTLSDTEIGIKVVRNLLSYRYIEEGKSTNELLFKSVIYVW